jgi:retron-type reverse transcriptase
MKRRGNLWPELVSFGNLLEAARRGAAGKRTRPDVASFLVNLETELFGLQRELIQGYYRPGPYRTFTIHEPKPRMISAAPFRDRVVHHALTQILEPLFERRFTRDSFACRAGMGTHRALARARLGAGRHVYVLRCDVRKYFPSIDHEILLDLLGRVTKCERTLELAGRIVAGSNPQEPVTAYFPGDDLFTPLERRHGLPLGNQTSQFFANVYLNPLDHFVARRLRPPVYTRYVDDFLLFADDKRALGAMRREIAGFLATLRLRLHRGKSRIYRCADGFPFLGWRVFACRARLARPNVVRFRRRMRGMQTACAQGQASAADIQQRIRAWIAHAAHGETWKLREQIFWQFACPIGCAV